MTLTVAVVFPELLGTYGDRGNAIVLVQRARWRGIDAALVDVGAGEPLPAADIYCLGGGEDGPELQAAEQLRADSAFEDAIGRGAPILAVCGGYQILGRTFPAPDGTLLPGVGILDVETEKGPGPRAVGELLVQPSGEDALATATAVARGEAPYAADAAAGVLASSVVAPVPPLTGFENHAGVTRRGPGVVPLGSVVRGIGNGDGTEGACSGRVVGTYLHGPVLARNPALADQLLAWATGAALGALDDDEENALRAERIAAARRPPRERWGILRRPMRATARLVPAAQPEPAASSASSEGSASVADAPGSAGEVPGSAGDGS